MKRKQSALSDFWPKKDTTEAPPAREAVSPRVTTEQKPHQLSRRLDPWFDPSQDDFSSLLPPAAKRVATEQEPQQSSHRLNFSSGPSQYDLSSSVPPIAERVVTSQASPGFQPFGAKNIYVCPYVAIQKCDSAEEFFSTYRSLCGHVSSCRQKDCLASTYEEDPLENGTIKIPCARGCGEAFTSHQQANHHAKKPASCPMPKREHIDCAWLQCSFLADDEKGMANLIRYKHAKDNRGAYQCSQCAQYYHYDLDKLAIHQKRCKPLKSESCGRSRLRYADRFSKAVEHELRNRDFDTKIIYLTWHGCGL